jgi:hypothetical protein
MTEEQEKALREFNAASNALKKPPHYANTEHLYGKTYAKCVRLGIFPKLKKKYTKC